MIVSVSYQFINSFNAISLNLKSSSSESSDDPYNKIPRLLSSKSKRIKHEKWIDDFMEKYLQERFSPKDYRLMNWVCTTTELTNDQLKALNISKLDSHEDLEVESNISQLKKF